MNGKGDTPRFFPGLMPLPTCTYDDGDNVLCSPSHEHSVSVEYNRGCHRNDIVAMVTLNNASD